MLKEMKAEKLMSQEYSEIDGELTVSKVLPKFKDSKDVVIVLHNNKYLGVITQKDIIRNNISVEKTKTKKLARKAPKITKETTLKEITRLMIESHLLHLPVIEHETVVGVVKANDILEQTIIQGEQLSNVKEVIGDELITLEPEDTLAKALVTCREHNIARIPIQENDQLQGIISLHDIINERILGPIEGRDELTSDKNNVLDIAVKELMHKDVITLPDTVSLNEVIEKMFEEGISSIVIAEKGKGIGIITKRDILGQISYQSNRKPEEVIVQISSKENIDKEYIKQETITFLEKYKRFFNEGQVNIHITKHRETLKNAPLLHCKLRIRTNHKYDLSSEGYGEEQVIKEALRKLKELLYKSHKKRGSTKEILDYTNTSAL